MNLSQLRPPEGQKKEQRRVGRGMGSGRQKTSGRGHKGARSISGYSKMRGFEGGQMPLHRRLPKRGFTNIFKKHYAIVNIGLLEKLEGDSFDPGKLLELGVIKKLEDGLKILLGERHRLAFDFEGRVVGERFAIWEIQRAQKLLIRQYVDPSALLLCSSYPPMFCRPREGAAQSYGERLEVRTDSGSDRQGRVPFQTTLVDSGFQRKTVAGRDALTWFVWRCHGHAAGGDRVERFCVEPDSSKSQSHVDAAHRPEF